MSLHDVIDQRTGEIVIAGVPKATAERERKRLDKEAKAARDEDPHDPAGTADAMIASPAVQQLIQRGAVQEDAARQALEAEAETVEREVLPPATHEVVAR